MDQTSEYEDFPKFAKFILKARKEVESKNWLSIKEQSSESKPVPKQGHHIINKGVINIYEDILERFVRDHKGIFKGKSYNKLKATEMITEHEEEKKKKALDFLEVENPLSPDSRKFIKETTVWEKDQTDGDENAKQFGIAKLILILCANFLMYEIYFLVEGNEEGIILQCEDYLSELRGVIEKYFKFSADYVFVDQQARKEWEKKALNSELDRIEDYIEEVWKIIEDIAKDVTPLVVKWGKGAFWVPQVLPLDESEVTSGT